MSTSNAPNPLFLREEELDRGLDFLHLAHRRLIAETRTLRTQLEIDEIDQRVLMLLRKRPGTALAELATTLGQSKQTLSRHVRSLEVRGLVTGVGSNQDRRMRLLRLSEKGLEANARLAHAEKRRIRGAFKAAGADAVAGYHAVLQELASEGRRRQLAHAQGGEPGPKR